MQSPCSPAPPPSGPLRPPSGLKLQSLNYISLPKLPEKADFSLYICRYILLCFPPLILFHLVLRTSPVLLKRLLNLPSGVLSLSNTVFSLYLLYYCLSSLDIGSSYKLSFSLRLPIVHSTASLEEWISTIFAGRGKHVNFSKTEKS